MSRRIVEIQQNETARINIYHVPNTDLLVTGLENCCAVLITDKNGNISLTHVDAYSDLGFIGKEIFKMRGEYSIDIIKNTFSSSRLAEDKLAPHIKAAFGLVKNTKGSNDVRTTKTGTVLVRINEIGNIMLVTPKFLHVQMIAAANAHLRDRIPLDNPLRKDMLEEGNKPAQLRVYERAFMALWESKPVLPTLVFDNTWTGEFAQLSASVSKIIDKAGQLKSPQERMMYILGLPRNVGSETLVSRMPQRIEPYCELLREYQATFKKVKQCSDLSVIDGGQASSYSDNWSVFFAGYTSKLALEAHEADKVYDYERIAQEVTSPDVIAKVSK